MTEIMTKDLKDMLLRYGCFARAPGCPDKCSCGHWYSHEFHSKVVTTREALLLSVKKLTADIKASEAKEQDAKTD